MFDQRVTRLELPVFRNVTDSEDNRPIVGSNFELPRFRPKQIQKSRWPLILGLHARFWKNDVRAEVFGDVILHYLACTLRLRAVECQAELIQPPFGQIMTILPGSLLESLE